MFSVRGIGYNIRNSEMRYFCQLLTLLPPCDSIAPFTRAIFVWQFLCDEFYFAQAANKLFKTKLLLYSGALLWNSLPEDIRKLQSFAQYRNAIAEYYSN